MPTALQLQRDHAEDLQVLFVDVQGDDLAGVEQSALSYQWLGAGAMWTTTRPLRPTHSGIPYAVLLDADGKVALSGYVREIEEELEEFLEKNHEHRSELPVGLQEALVPAWRALQSGELATAARSLAPQDDDDAGLREARAQLLTTARTRIDTALTRLQRMVGDGELLGAVQLAARLAEVDERAAKWHERLGSTEFAAELAAARALQELARPLLEDGIDEELAPAFDAFAQEHAGTHAAARARRYAKVCREG